jgi:hypothetical protein
MIIVNLTSDSALDLGEACDIAAGVEVPKALRVVGALSSFSDMMVVGAVCFELFYRPSGDATRHYEKSLTGGAPLDCRLIQCLIGLELEAGMLRVQGRYNGYIPAYHCPRMQFRHNIVLVGEEARSR